MPDLATTSAPRPFRYLRQALPWLLALAVATCTADQGGPTTTGVGYFSFRPVYRLAGGASLSQFGIVADTVRVRITRPVDELVLDTAVVFPADSTQLSLALPVTLVTSPELLDVVITISAQGAVIFLDSVQVQVQDGPPGSTTPPTVVFEYVGPGTNIGTLDITPGDTTIVLGDTLFFAAAAFDSVAAPVTTFYVAWKSSDTSLAKINADGRLIAPNLRGNVSIVATTPTGIADTTVVTFAPTPVIITADSGTAQAGIVGDSLAALFVARVKGADSLGISGIGVRFTAVTAGGAVRDTLVLTDVNGRARTRALLGTGAGAYSYTADVVGAALTPATFVATATPTAASAIAILSGNAQVDTNGKTLTLPLTVEVRDAFNNVVPGATVVFTRPFGLGVLADDSVVTDGSGIASVGYTLGGTVGTDTIRATLAGTSAFVDFTATAISATPVAVDADSGDAQAVTVSLGFADSLVVRVFDAGVNPVPGATVDWQVVAGDATLNAPSSITGADGRARIGVTAGTVAGPVLVYASIAGVADTADFTLTVMAGAPATMVIASGNGQTALAGGVLPLSPEVMIDDAFGNRVAGVPVSFTVSAGGGSIDSATATTDSTGRANAGNWTLGLAGLNQVRATTTAVPSDTLLFDATATPAGTSKLWTAAVDNSWNLAGNWSPSGIPTASDNVFIPAAPASPVLSVAAGINDLVIESGATVTLAAITLSVAGDADIAGTLTGTGTLNLTGAAKTFSGSTSTALVLVNGTPVLDGPTSITGPLTVNGGTLTVGGQALTVTGALTVQGTAQLVMTDPADSVDVGGALAYTSGASGFGSLTGGIMVARGAFTQTGGASDNFAASGSHTLRLAGASPQTVSFTNPGTAASRFRNLQVANAAGVTLGSNVTVLGDVTVNAGTVTGTGQTTTHFGGLTTAPAAWQVSTTQFAAAPSVYPDSLPRNVTLTASWTLSKAFRVDSAFAVTSTGSLALGGQALTVGSTFTSSGVVSMSNAGDSLDVTGAFLVNSGISGVADLSDGVLVLRGSFTQVGGSSANFQASGTHRVRFLGSAPQTVTFSNPGAASSRFAGVEFGNASGITLSSNIYAAGAALVTSGTVTGIGRTASLAADLTTPYAGWQVSTTSWVGTPSVYPDSLPRNVSIATGLILNKPLKVDSAFTVTSTGTLDLSGHSLRIGGAFTQSGFLSMQAAGDTLDVAGPILVNSGQSSAALLTDGLLRVRGGFTQVGGSSANFQASGTHLTRFELAGGQAATFSNPGNASSRFQHLELADSVNFGSSIHVAGDLSLLAGGKAQGTATATLAGSLSDPTGLAYRFANTILPATVGSLPDSLVTNVTLSGSWTLAQRTRITGTLSVASTGTLDLNGDTLVVTGNLTQTGILVSALPAGELEVLGNLSVNSGVSGVGSLIEGHLLLRGGFTQTGGSSSNFAPTVNFLTTFAGIGGHTVGFSNGGVTQSRFHHLAVSDSLALVSAIGVTGDVTIDPAGRIAGPAQSATVLGGLADPSGLGWRVLNTTIPGGQAVPDSLVTNLTLTGAWTLSARQWVDGAFSITSTGSLDLGAQRLDVTGALTQTGQLRMLQPLDTLEVGGLFTVNSGLSGIGDLVDGALILHGGLTQASGSSSNFAASSGHLTWFVGTTGQNVSFSNGGLAASHFHRLTVSDSLAFGSDFAASGQVNVDAAARAIGAARTAALGGSLSDDFTGWLVGTTVFAAPFSTLPATLVTNVVLQDSTFLPYNVTVTGDFTLQANAYLGFGGHGLGVSGNFTQTGHLPMFATGDSLEVGGNLLVNSAQSSAGDLVAGVIVIHGGFSQTSGASDNFVADVPHRVRFTDAGGGTIGFTNPTASMFGDLDIDATGTLTLTSDVRTLGTFKVPGGPVTLAAAAQRLLRAGALSVDGLTLDGIRVQLNSPAVNAAQFDNVTFTNIDPALTQLSMEFPGQTGDTIKLNNVAFSGTPTTGRYVYVADSVANDAPAVIGFYNSTPLNGALFTGVEGSVGDPATILWTHLEWATQPSDGTELLPIVASPQVGAYDPSGGLVTGYTGTVTLGFFADPSAGAAALGGNAVAAAGGVATFDSLTISLAGTGYQLQATSPELGLSPPSNGFNISIPLPAGTTTAFNNGGGDNDWFNASNWTAGVPDSVDNVFVYPSQSVTVNAPARANRVIIGTGGSIVLNTSLTVDGSVTAGNTISGGGQLVAQGSGELSGQVGDLVITGSYVIPSGGQLAAQSLAIGGAGVLDLNGRRVDVTGDFGITGTAVLQMDNAADSLFVGGNFTAAGGSTNGLLTSGLLVIGGDFTQSPDGGNDGFRADVGHVTRFVGGAPSRTIYFGSPVQPADPFSTSNSRFGRLELIDGIDSIASTVAVTEDLLVVAAQVISTSTGSGGPAVAGNVTVQAGVPGFSPLDLSLGGVLDFQPSPDNYQVGTTLFFGDGQIIPVLPYNNLHVGLGTATLGGDITAAGQVKMGISDEGPGFTGTLVIGGHALTAGSLVTTGQGTLTMNNPLDSVDVAGSSDFGGGVDTALTAGVLVARGDIYLSDSVFIASGTHRTKFQPLSAAQLWNTSPEMNGNRFNRLAIMPGSTMNFNAFSVGALIVSDTLAVEGSLLQANPGKRVIALGPLAVGTGASLVVDTLEMHQTLDLGDASLTAFLVRYAGTGQVIHTGLTYTQLEVTGTAALGGSTLVTEDARVAGSGQLTIGAFDLSVTRTFRTLDSGTVVMTDPASILNADTAEFAGGSTAGLLTAGTLRTRALIQSNVTDDFSYTATGTHVTQIGTPVGGSEYRIQMASGGGGASQLQNLLLDDGGQIIVPTRIVGRVQISGKLRTTPQGSAGVIGDPGAFLAVIDSLIITDASTAITLDTLEVHGGFAVQTNTLAAAVVRFAGAGQVIPDSQGYQGVEVTGTAGLETTANVGSFKVLGNGQFSLASAQQLIVSGDFATAENGTLQMNGAGADLFIGGNATFGGGSSVGLLTDGTIRIAGNFTQIPGSSTETFTTTNTGVRFQGGSGAQLVTIDPAAIGNFRAVGVTNPNGIVISGLMVVTDSVGTSGPIMGDSLYQFGTFFMNSGAQIGVRVLKTSGVFSGSPSLYAVDRTHIMNANSIPSVVFDTLVINALGAYTFFPVNANQLIVAGTGSPFGNGSPSAFELDQANAVRSVITGNVLVEGNAYLRLANDTVVAGGDFITRLGGRLILNHPDGSLEVTGNAHFEGTSEIGQMTAGRLFIEGGLYQLASSSPSSFRVDGATIEWGTLGAHVLSFATPDSSYLPTTTGSGTSTLAFDVQGRARIVGNLSGYGVNLTGDSLWIDSMLSGGPATATASLAELRVGQLDQFGSFGSFVVGTGHITGPGALPFNLDPTFDSLFVHDTVFGQLSQTITTKYLEVTGDGNPRHLGGGSGYFYLAGGDGNTFVPVNGDVVVRGAGARIENGQGFLQATGGLTVDQGGVIGAAGGFSEFDGDVLIDGASTAGLLVGGSLTVGGKFTQGATASSASYAPDSSFTTRFKFAGGHAVSFATPTPAGGGGSYFGTLEFSGDAGLVLQTDTDLWVEGTLVDTAFGNPTLQNTAAALRTLTVRDVNVQGITFDHLQLQLAKAGAPAAGTGFMDNVTFNNFLTTEDQFVVDLPGASTQFNWGGFTWTQLDLGGGDTGHYIVANDSDGGVPDVLTISIGTNQSADPSNYFLGLNGAVISPFPP